MTAPTGTPFGPCDVWPVLWPCDVSCESVATTGHAVRFATEVLWALSGRQFGLCAVTLRPCRGTCLDGWGSDWFGDRPFWSTGLSYPTPALIGGAWFNVICGSCGDTCSCSQLSQVELPAPVYDVIQVKVDGSPLATGAYRLDDDRTLVRIDGGEWPRCNDLRFDDTAPGTWSVTARFGLPVPEGAAWAVGELSCQLINALNGVDCRLPNQVTQLVRQGVTIQMDSLTELLKSGVTGLYFVDLFIHTWNPGRLRRRSRTYHVDGARARRVGT